MTEKQQDDTIKSRIIGLLNKGYTRSQLINDWDFAERTVDSAIKDYKEQGGNEADEAKKDDSDAKAIAIPAKLDIKQVIVPEYLIKHLSFIDGDKKQVAVDILLIWEAARRSVMEDVMILQGLTAAQAQTTETQLRILREAKSDSKEVAQEAAEQAALMVGEKVLEVSRQAAATASPNPMASMMVRTMEPYFAQTFARLFGMFGGFGQAQGIMPGQPPQQSPPQGQPPGFTPGTQQMSKKEMKEVFGDD